MTSRPLAFILMLALPISPAIAEDATATEAEQSLEAPDEARTTIRCSKHDSIWVLHSGGVSELLPGEELETDLALEASWSCGVEPWEPVCTEPGYTGLQIRRAPARADLRTTLVSLTCTGK